MTRPLTRSEREWVFRRATHGFEGSAARWALHTGTGLTDPELAEALRFELGIYGGSGGPGEISIAFQGAGLRIWGGFETPNTVTDAPLFEGAATIAMARETYGIRDPEDRQLSFL